MNTEFSYSSIQYDEFVSKGYKLLGSGVDREGVGVYVFEAPEKPVVTSALPFVFVSYVEECFTMVFGTSFKGKDGFERSLSVTGIDSYETAVAMARHLGWQGEVKNYRKNP